MHQSICDFVLDCFQNALEAGSTRIELTLRETESTVGACVADNGRGMSPRELQAARDPFTTDGRKHPSRRVGLGLPFLLQAAEMTAGSCRIDSEPGKGTRVFFELPRGHLDTPPLGSVPELLLQCLCFQGDYQLVAERIRGAQSYRVLRSELRQTLDGLEDAGALILLREYLRTLEAALAAGETKE